MSFRRVSTQQGQAMTEFFVVVVMLVIPLFIVLRIVAGMLSQQQKMDVAARYAAWERTVWYQSAPEGPGGSETIKTDDQIALDIDRRIFAVDRRDFYSNDSGSFDLDPFLKQVAGGNEALLEERESQDGSLRYAQQASSESEPEGLVGAANKMFEAWGRFTRFDLNTNGVYLAEVSVALVDLQRHFGMPLEFLDALTIRRSSTIFGEAWTAGDKAQAAYVISGLVPQQFADSSAMDGAQRTTAGMPISRELDEDWLKFGYVTIEPLPEHRLGPKPP